MHRTKIRINLFRRFPIAIDSQPATFLVEKLKKTAEISPRIRMHPKTYSFI